MGTVKEVSSDEGDGVFPLAANVGGGSISVNAAKPVATISQLADYLVSGFWAYNNALPHKWASNTITYNITGLNADEQFLARSALAAWHDVANLTFIETTGSANITFTHNGSMQAVTNASWYGSGAMASATVNISTNWVTSDGGANDGKTGIDSYAYQTYIHEIGHALGLGHQGPYNGSAVYSTNALYANDTWQYSIMSYFSEPNYSGSSYRYVVTPQMADIYAVATMYGAATTTRTGDTIYGFNSNAGAVFSFGNYTSAPALTIYDNGGSDTLDCSLYSNAQRIDLHGGAFSSIGGLVNNIGIALNTVIEKAIGGSGNDTLIASDLGCTLMGGAGVDVLTGGAGNDVLDGGSEVDALNCAFATQSVTVDLPGRIALGAEIGTDTLINIENVVAGSGNDKIAGSDAINVLDGGVGIDLVSYYAVSSGVTIDLTYNVGIDGTSTDTLLNFENANGTAYNDRISGTAAANVLDGLGGVDLISYYGSSQRVVLNLATGTGVCGNVTDTLRNFEKANGSANGDSITGNSGVNVLNGLGGADVLTGGGSGDTFVFAAGQANGDSITDFIGNGAATGDILNFIGFGTAAQGATLTQVNATQWQIHSGLDGHNEYITLTNGASIHSSDFMFV